MQPHTEALVLYSFLDPILNLPNFHNLNHVLNTLILPNYSLINAHLRHISPNHTHCYISLMLLFMPQASRFQKEATRWRKIMINSSSSFKPLEANKQKIKTNKQDSDEKMTKFRE